jgi:hypothetical protein
MDYTDINGRPIDIKKKAALHVKKFKQNKKETEDKLKLDKK